MLTMEVVGDGTDLFVITSYGFGKRTSTGLYPLHRRGGKGVRTIKLTETKGVLAGARIVRDNQELVVVSKDGIVIRVSVNGISRTGRATQGVKVMKVQAKDRVSALALVVSGDDGAVEQYEPETEEEPEPESSGDDA